MAIVAVGSVNTDLVVRVDRFPVPGETLYGRDFATHAGGKGANQAAAAARLGATVSMLGAVGDDASSVERVDGLRAVGVDVSSILVRSETPGGIALIQVDSSGQNQIVIVPGANGTVSAEDVKVGLPKIAHGGDLLLAQLELPLDTVQVSLQIARSQGVRTVVNTAPFVEGTAELLPLIDILVVNEIEAGQLLGREPISLEQADSVARELRKTGPEIIFITLGAAGAVLFDGNESIVVAAPTVDVVDTTGAGDACVGAFAMALDEGMQLRQAAQLAVIAGSFAVRREGAQPSQPTRHELKAFVEELRTRQA
jgi:ribokinase